MKREAAHDSRAPLAIGNYSRRNFRPDTRPPGLRAERRLGYHTNGFSLAATRRLAQRVLNVEHPNLG
jgi:hypothetical protein